MLEFLEFLTYYNFYFYLPDIKFFFFQWKIFSNIESYWQHKVTSNQHKFYPKHFKQIQFLILT